MCEKKKVVGWAVKAVQKERPTNVHWRITRLYDAGSYTNYAFDKCKRNIFTTRDVAFEECYKGAVNKDNFDYKVVRITRKVKPKKYYVEVGPFATEAEAKMCVVYRSNFQNPFTSKIVTRNV